MSTKEMTINQIKSADKDFGANHTIKVSGFKDGDKVTNKDLMDAIISLQKEFHSFKKYVLGQFTKHGWTK